MAFPGETTKTAAEQLKKAVPQLVVTPVGQNVNDNIIMNTKKPPFDNLKVRLAVSHAIDRRGLIQAVHQGGAVARRGHGAAAVRRLGPLREGPAGPAGLRQAGRREGQGAQAAGRGGLTPQKPLKVEMVTRAIAIYVDMASFVINELKQVGIEATLKQIETAQWHAMATRGEYQIGANLTGLGADDPDANFYENYACGSPRNYSAYCNEQVMKMIDQQSQEIDPKKRLALVLAIQKKLEEDAARPILAWRIDYFTVWPYVKNLIPHHNIYNFGRMQDVWSAKGTRRPRRLRRVPRRRPARRRAPAARRPAREDLHRPAARHRAPDAARHVDGDLRSAAPGAGRHRRHPVLDGRLREARPRSRRS